MNKTLADGHEISQKRPATAMPEALSFFSFDALPSPGTPVPLGDFLLEDARFPAVYFLFDRGLIVYIGQSKTLRARIEAHLSEGQKRFDAVAFLRCSVNHLTRIEGHYIREYAPKYNDCSLSHKVREREAWRAERNRDRLANAGAPSDPEAFQFIDAAECIIEPGEVGEFLRVAESDAAAWLADGKVQGTSVLDLIQFVALNSRELTSAQARYDAL